METPLPATASVPLEETRANGGHRPSGHVIVVGGGVAGLVTARDLARAGVRVSVMESSDRLGGQVRTIDFADRRVDVGAEAVFATPPHLSALLRELGLMDEPLGSHRGHSLLGHPRGAQPMPAGLGPSGPTRIRPVLESGMLSLPGLVRAGLEPLLAKLNPPLAPDQDISVGDFLAGRFGHEVVRRFVDPMLGSLHSGDVYRLSLRGTAPQLVAAAEHRTSLMRRSAPRPTTNGPAFVSWADGLQTFIDALAADIEGHGGRIARGVAVREIVRVDGRWQVRTSEGGFETDGVVLATPTPATIALLSPLTRTAETLREQRFASVVNVLAALRADQVFQHDAGDRFPLRATPETNGILLPSDAPWTMKAATFLGTKWPHLRRTADGRDDNAFLVRVSAGRVGLHVVDELDDEELTTRLLDDLHRVTGVHADVLDSTVVRWPAMPQCEVGHPARVAALRAELAAGHPRLALAGAGVDGMGMAAVVRSGQAAAASLIAALS